ERFQSAAEVALLLESYLAHLRQPATVAAPELPSSPPTARTGRPTMQPRMTPRKWLLAAVGLVGVLGLLAAAGAGVLVFSNAPGTDLGTSPAGAVPSNQPPSLQSKDGLVCLLVNKKSGRCLSIAGGSAEPGAKIEQGPKPDQAGAAERWTLLGTGDAFRLRN